MNRKYWVVLLTLLVIATGQALAQDSVKVEPNIDGTYILVSRLNLTDSTIMNPADIQGMITFDKGYSQFCVAWRDANGLMFSTASISKVTLTDTTYTETLLYGYFHDEIHSQAIKYFVEPQTMTTPLKREGTKITFKLPFDPPTLTFDGDKVVAVAKGMFVDTFERVK